MKTSRQAIPGLVLFEHEFEIPLDHSLPEGAKITVFAREVTTPDQEGKDLPWLLYLQGGPGFPAARPTSATGWLGAATQEFRVLLLDQRGTGLSTPVTPESLAVHATPREQADYLSHFRTDAIVADAEWIRRELQGENGKWTLLGQSFGGFCSVHYLSVAPDSLSAVLITGGLPGLDTPIETVYRHTYRKLIDKNENYYERYPVDVDRVRAIAQHITDNDVRLPNGDPLTVHGFQALGIGFGMSDGYEPLHYLVEGAFVEGPEGPTLSHPFLCGVQNATAYDTNPIYALLHEPIYAQGRASGWCASRLRPDFQQFEETSVPLFFTAEMIYPWMFEEMSAVRGMKETAELLAQKVDWPELYNTTKLALNTVPVAAAVYHDDVYVPVDLSLETAARIPGVRTWITNEYEHNGLRADGARIFTRLLDMTRGKL
jgi:pimeloyl-ACP methyl ester carboxylesterase